MKGFIEVTISADGDKEFVNVDKIFSIGNSLIFYSIDGDQYLRVKETYDELKALIKEATKPTACNECPYSYDKTLDDALAVIGFEGTMDALNRLKIRKEDSTCTSEAETT